MKPRSDAQAKMPLHCIAFRYYSESQQEWVPKFEYVNSTDSRTAKVDFIIGLPRHVRVGRNLIIDAIGPVIGYFEEKDQHGKIILAVN